MTSIESTNDFLSLGYVRLAGAGALKMSLNLEDTHSVRARDQAPDRGHRRDTNGQRVRERKERMREIETDTHTRTRTHTEKRKAERLRGDGKSRQAQSHRGTPREEEKTKTQNHISNREVTGTDFLV